MDLFEEILHDMCLLTEDASINSINDAIIGMHPAWIKYNDGEGSEGKNKRYICPVAYGISTAGNPVIRAFQTQGSSKRGANKWKLFRLDRIVFWRTVGSQTFDPEQLVGLNPSSDAQMETVYTISPVGKAKQVMDRKLQANINPQSQVKQGPITKQDIDGIEIEEPQKDNMSWSFKDIVNNIFSRIRNKFTKKQEEPIDTNQEIDYINNKNQINSPEAEPIYKDEINGITDTDLDNSDDEKEQKKITNTETEPVTKDDLTNNSKEEVKANFKDLMSRMDKLNNNNEEYNNI